MSKHTPGPWFVTAYEVPGEVLPLFRLVGPQTSCPHATWVAGVSPKGIGKTAAECRANARLIAAAPELYEVCEEVREHFAYFSEWDLPIGLEERLDAALAKVEDKDGQ